MVFQDMHDKIHGCDRVVVDDDFEERLEFGVGLFEDLDFGERLMGHFFTTRDTKYTKDEG
jgi:hypothetical protein